MNPPASEQLRAAAEHVRGRGPIPRVGVVLGSGLGAFAEQLSGAEPIAYAAIPHMPAAAVAGHAGNLVLGTIDGFGVACLQGRVHLYEGHPPERVVFGVRLLAALGCRAVLITNAAGGIADDLAPGALMLITDHLNLTGHNPLVGPHRGDGPRFPDLSRAYDPALCDAARQAAQDLGAELHEGVYAGLLGPSYETPAEIRMLRGAGADAVGMSTVIEVVALRERGVRVGAMSCITNRAAGLQGEPLDHEDVQRVATAARERFTRLLTEWVKRAGRTLT